MARNKQFKGIDVLLATIYDGVCGGNVTQAGSMLNYMQECNHFSR